MDVDVDTPPSFNSKVIFPNWTRASLVRDGKLVPHPCGVYPQSIAVDPFTNLSAIPYDVAGDHGYLKVDFLHLHVYAHFSSREEIESLIAKEPDWTLLQLSSTHEKLFQLSKHGELLKLVKPTDLMMLADCMALIRPGKKQLLGLYQKNQKEARKALFVKADDGYAFKRSHAIAYAYVVILQLHLIEMGKL